MERIAIQAPGAAWQTAALKRFKMETPSSKTHVSMICIYTYVFTIRHNIHTADLASRETSLTSARETHALLFVDEERWPSPLSSQQIILRLRTDDSCLQVDRRNRHVSCVVEVHSSLRHLFPIEYRHLFIFTLHLDLH